MSEAVEYRVKENKAVLSTVSALVLNVVGMAQFTLMFGIHPKYQIVAVGMGLFFLAGSFYMLAFTKAMRTRGKCRDFFEWKRGEQFSDPPLDEWGDSLEDRDAFEVNYGK